MCNASDKVGWHSQSKWVETYKLNHRTHSKQRGSYFQKLAGRGVVTKYTGRGSNIRLERGISMSRKGSHLSGRGGGVKTKIKRIEVIKKIAL